MPDKMSLLRDVFGHDHFRPGQETIIDALINGTDVMAILPTGGGKSLCYQLPALVLPGMTIVISPLISLMEDQVSSLKMRGVAAYAYHSHLSSRQRAQLQEALEHQKIKLLYISPERLANEAFFSCISRCHVSMICVDEAHCLSQWGDEFRPAYRKIGKLIPRLNSTTRPVICAFTGSATPQIRDDIIESLGLQDPLILAHSFDRPNLYFQTIHTEKKMSALMPLLQKYRGLCGIIYCLTRNSVEALAIALKEEAFPCLVYHGGMDATERLANQEAWMKSKGRLMIATSAFGMGIDKPDVRFVIHYQLPTDMESYYQEAGRAGRDGKPSD
ncbi:MAG: ATP-dependent DNA helicase RecQ, partial [Lachnospiraceae bacterium]|nr:ATP-dependent DNA helicase RecQ [Candidatus Equihabitans merdae]